MFYLKLSFNIRGNIMNTNVQSKPQPQQILFDQVVSNIVNDAKKHASLYNNTCVVPKGGE